MESGLVTSPLLLCVNRIAAALLEPVLTVYLLPEEGVVAHEEGKLDAILQYMFIWFLLRGNSELTHNFFQQLWSEKCTKVHSGVSAASPHV